MPVDAAEQTLKELPGFVPPVPTATLAGAKGFTAIGQWAAETTTHTLTALGMSRAAADEATFRRTFARLDNVSHQGSGSLYLNMRGDISHSRAFRGGGGQIVAFDLPASLVNQIRGSALPQRMPRGFSGSKREWNMLRKNSPEISDPKVSPGLIGVPESMIDEIMGSIVGGSGRIL